MKVLIMNGPNLNLLGAREPEIYGSTTFESFFETLKLSFSDIELTYYHSNLEGELVDTIQSANENFDGLIINPAAYSHYSIAITDALRFLKIPVIEVHLSNIFSRESYRQTLITASACLGVISGLGLYGYQLALLYLKQNHQNQS